VVEAFELGFEAEELVSSEFRDAFQKTRFDVSELFDATLNGFLWNDKMPLPERVSRFLCADHAPPEIK
jgi:hypothetical protein